MMPLPARRTNKLLSFWQKSGRLCNFQFCGAVPAPVDFENGGEEDRSSIEKLADGFQESASSVDVHACHVLLEVAGWETRLAYVSNWGHNNRVKPVDFRPKALDFIRAQPVSIRQQIGEALRDLQKGVTLGMPLSRPMTDIDRGVHELRIKAGGSTVRVFYCLGRSDAIIVFHAFQKKSQKTPVREISMARQRLQEVLDEEVES